MATDNQVVLRIQLDEGKTEDQLKQLVLDIEKTKAAQAQLNKERRQGILNDDEFSKRTLGLRTQLRGQTQEQASLTKNLELYRTAQNGQVDGYKATQAALSLAIRQQQELAGSANDSTEASQALTKQIAEYREILAQTDEKQNSFFRRIGDYGRGTAGLKELTQQLVQLEEEQKRFVMGSDQELKVRNQIGFLQTAAIQKAAQEGRSYEEATNFIREYGEAIRPATADLVRLAEQQKKASESGDVLGEEMQQIGFRLGAAKKQLEDVTKALDKLPEEAADAGKETKGLGAGLLEAAQSSDVLGGAIGVLTTAKEKYTVATNIAKTAIGGEVTALGVLKLALLATGLGALVVVLGSVIAFLTKTQAGTDFLSRKMAALGAAVRVVTNLATDFGGKLVAAAEDPKKAFSDLVDFLEQNVVNRIKSIGVLIDGIKTGNIEKIGDSFIQATTGITDGTAKIRAFSQQVDAAAGSAERLAQMERELQRAEDDNIATNKTLLNQVERLKNIRDNEFNTIQVRQKANEDAYKIEMQREATLVTNARNRQALLEAQIEQEGGRNKVSRERYQELQNAINEVQDIQEDAAGKQNELITNRYQLEQENLDKLIERRAQAFTLQTAQLDKQLAQVRINSDEELSLQQQKLRVASQAELNVKKLTVAQKKAIDTKYESDSLVLSLDFNRRRLVAALQAQVDLTAAELGQQQAGADEALRLQTAQIENQRKLAIAGLDARADNEAKIAAINSQAAQQRQKAEYDEAVRLLGDFLEKKRQQVELDFAKGITKEGEYQRQLAAVQKAGIDLQANLNKDYNQDTPATEKAAADYEISQAQRVKEEKKKIKETEQQIQDAAFQAAAQTTDLIIENFGRESAAGQAALITKKTLAIAEIAINLQKQLALNKVTGAEISAAIPAPLGPVLGAAYVFANDALAIAAAAAGTAAILKLQRGGIALGPSHEDGGIPLYRRGRHTGIEIEGGEPVLTAGVSRNPLLLSIASLVNQAAGGRALVPGVPQPHLALGGVSTPLVQQQLTGSVQPPIDYDRLARAMSRVNIETKVSAIKTALTNDSFTNNVSND